MWFAEPTLPELCKKWEQKNIWSWYKKKSSCDLHGWPAYIKFAINVCRDPYNSACISIQRECEASQIDPTFHSFYSLFKGFPQKLQDKLQWFSSKPVLLLLSKMIEKWRSPEMSFVHYLDLLNCVFNSECRPAINLIKNFSLLSFNLEISLTLNGEVLTSILLWICIKENDILRNVT